MAEGGTGSKGFAKVFQKRVTRTKELMLQNLGKADKTTDDAFDGQCNDFGRQQASAAKLQKELKNYVTCVKAMATAGKAFYETLKETYEDDWTGYTEMASAVETLSALWDDYVCKITGHVQEPLGAYISRFPEMKNKIAKRNRKLVYYDHARHHLVALESAKKKDDNKIFKAQEDLQDAKRVYEEIKTELNRELPSMYDSRRSFLSSHFNSIFCAEAKFQEESAKIKNGLADVTERLQRESSDVFLRPYTSARNSEVGDSGDRGSDTSPGLSTFYNVNVQNDTGSNKSSETDLRRPSSASSSDVQPSPKMTSNEMSLQRQPRATATESTPSYDEPTATYPATPAAMSFENRSERTASVTVTTTTTTADTNGDLDLKDVGVLSLSPPSGKGVKLEEPEVEAAAEAESPTTPTQDATYEAVVVGAQLNNNEKVPGDLPAHVSAHVPGHVSAHVSRDGDGPKVKVVEVTTPDSENDDYEAPVNGAIYKLAAEEDDIYKVPSSNETVETSLPPGVLFKVETIHAYQGEDMDELNFEAGEIIYVIPFDEPDDQDDGWLLGFKKDAKEKGVFPENFTKRI